MLAVASVFFKEISKGQGSLPILSFVLKGISSLLLFQIYQENVLLQGVKWMPAHHGERTANSGKVELVGSGMSDGIIDPEPVIKMDGMAKCPPPPLNQGTK